MGRGEYTTPTQRYIVYQTDIWASFKGMEDTVATGFNCPLRTSGLPRDLPHLSSYGSGLERSH